MSGIKASAAVGQNLINNIDLDTFSYTPTKTAAGSVNGSLPANTLFQPLSYRIGADNVYFMLPDKSWVVYKKGVYQASINGKVGALVIDVPASITEFYGNAPSDTTVLTTALSGALGLPSIVTAPLAGASMVADALPSVLNGLKYFAIAGLAVFIGVEVTKLIRHN